MNSELALRAKVATLSAENRKLKRVAGFSREDSLLSRIKVDAEQLLLWRFAGIAITRRNCEQLSMTQRRWMWAIALLKHARIYNQGDVTATDFDLACTAIETSERYLKKQGLESLKIRLPKCVLFGS